MIDPGHQINCFNRRMMAQALLRVLAETGMLAMRTQSVWWSLQGPALASLDTILGRQRQDLLDGMTPLARRVRALSSDIVIDNMTLEAHARTVVPQLTATTVAQTLRELPRDHQAVADVIRCACILAATLDDTATLSPLNMRIAAHEAAATELKKMVLAPDEGHAPTGVPVDTAADRAEGGVGLG